jgi:hypothetical protein
VAWCVGITHEQAIEAHPHGPDHLVPSMNFVALPPGVRTIDHRRIEVEHAFDFNPGQRSATPAGDAGDDDADAWLAKPPDENSGSQQHCDRQEQQEVPVPHGVPIIGRLP